MFVRKDLGRVVMAVFMVLICGNFLNAKDMAVPPEEESLWIRHLLPLPHRISIKNKAVVKPGDISITMAAGSGEIVQTAVDELRQVFKDKAGLVPDGKLFDITVGTVDSEGKLAGIRLAEADALKTLPNNDQAYVIQSQGNNKLLVAGLDEKGVYYAVRTLCQLLEPAITNGQVSIPLANVLDWPDMEERGLWNFPPDLIPWMASIKLNYGKIGGGGFNVVRGQKSHTDIDTNALHAGRARALNAVPLIMHLNFQSSLLSAYPELAGKGDSAIAGRYFAHKQGDPHRAPCASNPLLAKILAEWMLDIASQDAREVSCWLTERPAQCACAECLRAGQFVAEARAFVNAWREVRSQYPDFVIRLFISTTTDERYYKILAETPPEVKIERCCNMNSARVRHLPRDLFINPLFDYYAARGRWIASYDVPYPASGAVETPEFKIPESSAHRIRDFIRQLIERRYKGAYGMTGWHRMGKEICGFNYQALAEWAWNLNGRSEREFAVAWATREGYANPDAVGDWSEIMGPIEFDVYDSDIPTCYSWGTAVNMIKTKQPPCLGEEMFRYYTQPEAFDQKLAACEQALKLSESFHSPYLANETRVVISYIKLAKYIYQAADAVCLADPSNPERNKALQEALAHLKQAGEENIQAIRQWRGALGPEKWAPRVYDAIKATEDTVQGISQAVEIHVK